jgi:hypothetical protein
VDQQGRLLFIATTRNGTGDVNTPSVIGQGGWQAMKFLFAGGTDHLRRCRLTTA